MEYLFPPTDFTGIGPHRLTWMISSGWVALRLSFREKDSHLIFSSIKSTYLSWPIKFLTWGIPVVVLYNAAIMLWSTLPNRRYHRWKLLVVTTCDCAEPSSYWSMTYIWSTLLAVPSTPYCQVIMALTWLNLTSNPILVRQDTIIRNFFFSGAWSTSLRNIFLIRTLLLPSVISICKRTVQTLITDILYPLATVTQH